MTLNNNVNNKENSFLWDVIKEEYQNQTEKQKKQQQTNTPSVTADILTSYLKKQKNKTQVSLIN